MVMISGVITPAHTAEVTIYLTLPDGTTEEHKVTSIADGSFTSEYTPIQIGVYKVKVSWEGDMDTKSAESEEKTFEVKAKEGSTISLSIEPEVVYI